MAVKYDDNINIIMFLETFNLKERNLNMSYLVLLYFYST